MSDLSREDCILAQINSEHEEEQVDNTLHLSREERSLKQPPLPSHLSRIRFESAHSFEDHSLHTQSVNVFPKLILDDSVEDEHLPL